MYVILYCKICPDQVQKGVNWTLKNFLQMILFNVKNELFLLKTIQNDM